MKLVELIIRPEKLEDLKAILNGLEIHGMTVAMVTGCGKQKGIRETYRGTQFSINLIPKVKVETVVPDEAVEGLIREVVGKLRTGKIGDGKIFVYSVEQAVRIRTGESGPAAI
jgi:nitrogen regulatory protein P-II 1